jgi:uncharacterized protein (DUF433 family)
MPLNLQAEPLPLRADEQGAVRVGDSRVTLDVVIHEFEGGASPEAIAQAYPTLRLADVYVVIAYYLRHREEVDDYLRARGREADRLRLEIEATQPERAGLRVNAGLRVKLLARREQMEQGNALPRQ